MLKLGGLGTYSLAFHWEDTFVEEVIGVLTYAYFVAYPMTSSVLDEPAFPLMDDSYELVSDSCPCQVGYGGPRIGQGKRNHFLVEYTYYQLHP